MSTKIETVKTFKVTLTLPRILGLSQLQTKPLELSASELNQLYNELNTMMAPIKEILGKIELPPKPLRMGNLGITQKVRQYAANHDRYTTSEAAKDLELTTMQVSGALYQLVHTGEVSVLEKKGVACVYSRLQRKEDIVVAPDGKMREAIEEAKRNDSNSQNIKKSGNVEE